MLWINCTHYVTNSNSSQALINVVNIDFFSDGEYIAIGSRDNSIYVYLVGEAGHKYSRVGRCSVSALSVVLQNS